MSDGKWWYTYDDNGNRTARAAKAENENNKVTLDKNGEYWEYTWDYYNRLVKVQQFNAPDNAQNVCVEYTYDANNHRIERISKTNSVAETTQYAYGRNGALTYQKKTSVDSVTTRTYMYLNNQMVGFLDKTDNKESLRYTVIDIQGSVTEVYEEDNNLIWKSNYTAFGIKAGETTKLLDFDGLYTGCDSDAETGLSYHWNRWRSEDGESWLSEDPIRDGINWYGYAGHNPINFIDKNGLFAYNENGEQISTLSGELEKTESSSPNMNGYNPTPSVTPDPQPQIPEAPEPTPNVGDTNNNLSEKSTQIIMHVYRNKISYEISNDRKTPKNTRLDTVVIYNTETKEYKVFENVQTVANYPSTDGKGNKVESCFMDTIGTSNFDFKVYTTTDVAPGDAGVITNTSTIDGRKVNESGYTEDAKSGGRGLGHSDEIPDGSGKSWKTAYSKQCFVFKKEDNKVFYDTLRDWGVPSGSSLKGTVFDVERR